MARHIFLLVVIVASICPAVYANPLLKAQCGGFLDSLAKLESALEEFRADDIDPAREASIYEEFSSLRHSMLSHRGYPLLAEAAALKGGRLPRIWELVETLEYLSNFSAKKDVFTLATFIHIVALRLETAYEIACVWPGSRPARAQRTESPYPPEASAAAALARLKRTIRETEAKWDREREMEQARIRRLLEVQHWPRD